MHWYEHPAWVRRAKLHLNWFDAEHHGILHGPTPVDAGMENDPEAKDKLKRGLYYLGLPDALLRWGTLPFRGSEAERLDLLVRALHHPSVAGNPLVGGNPIWLLRGKRRRAAWEASRQADHTTDAGVRFIAGFEGFAADWYDDGWGTQTIGYGHTSESLHGFTPPLSRTEGLALLRLDLAGYERSVKDHVTAHRSTRVLDALTSFVYNLGAGVLTDSNRIAAKVNAGDLNGAAAAMLRYDHAGGQQVYGLTRRRRAEVAILLHGDYSTG